MVARQATVKTALLCLPAISCQPRLKTSLHLLPSLSRDVLAIPLTSTLSHFDIDLDPSEVASGQCQSITLTLTDTLSLDVRDEVTSESLVSDILRHVKTKFLESLEDVCRSHPSSQYLCQVQAIYGWLECQAWGHVPGTSHV